MFRLLLVAGGIAWILWAVAEAAPSPAPEGSPAPSAASEKAAGEPKAEPTADAPPLAVTEADAGKTLAVVVGRRIEIRLAGNPTTGYSWMLKSVKGDAVRSLGEPRYVPTPAPERMVGTGGMFVFSLAAEKPGKAEVTLAYRRPWEKESPDDKTFAVTFDCQPDPTAERVKALKADLSQFLLSLKYTGPEALKIRHLFLSGRLIKMRIDPRQDRAVNLSDEEAGQIIDYLAAEGFLDRAVSDSEARPQGIRLSVGAGGAIAFTEDLGWGPEMLKRLDGLRAVLKGDAAKAMDEFLAGLSDYRKKWDAEAAAPAPKD